MTSTDSDLEGARLKALYESRFSGEAAERDAVWKQLCTGWFQKWVRPSDTVVELAAGTCNFINNIAAARKIAVDLNPNVAEDAAPGVEVLVAIVTDLNSLESGSADVVFVSNFFEHITREVILDTLREAHRILKPTGKILILQPNIRYCARNYWMFFDHITPIDDRSLGEALLLADFNVEVSIPRFLPYTMKSRLPRGDALIKLYLKVPLAWKIMGAQAFVVGTPKRSL